MIFYLWYSRVRFKMPHHQSSSAWWGLYLVVDLNVLTLVIPPLFILPCVLTFTPTCQLLPLLFGVYIWLRNSMPRHCFVSVLATFLREEGGKRSKTKARKMFAKSWTSLSCWPLAVRRQIRPHFVYPPTGHSKKRKKLGKLKNKL